MKQVSIFISSLCKPFTAAEGAGIGEKWLSKVLPLWALWFHSSFSFPLYLHVLSVMNKKDSCCPETGKRGKVHELFK